VTTVIVTTNVTVNDEHHKHRHHHRQIPTYLLIKRRVRDGGEGDCDRRGEDADVSQTR